VIGSAALQAGEPESLLLWRPGMGDLACGVEEVDLADTDIETPDLAVDATIPPVTPGGGLRDHPVTVTPVDPTSLETTSSCP
jgi:hypothetical protein